LIALTENTATIETQTGAWQNFRRKPNQPDRVLAWELEDEKRYDAAIDGACLWCERPFRAHRGGSPKRFCCGAHRMAFWSSLLRWAERAVAAGA
jgi:hypothetical protein